MYYIHKCTPSEAWLSFNDKCFALNVVVIVLSKKKENHILNRRITDTHKNVCAPAYNVVLMFIFRIKLLLILLPSFPAKAFQISFLFLSHKNEKICNEKAHRHAELIRYEYQYNNIYLHSNLFDFELRRQVKKS